MTVDPINAGILGVPSSAEVVNISDGNTHTNTNSNTENVQENEATNVVGNVNPVQPVVDFKVKHPLHTTWTMWYDNPGKRVSQASWGDNIKPIMTFDSVEDFWCLYNNIVPPSRLSSGSNYHLFRTGVQPMWEDGWNNNGGKWIIAFPKNRKDLVDEHWLTAILTIIGENLTEMEDVCGLVVSIRKQQDKLSLWTKRAMEVEVVTNIGKQLKESLGLPEAWRVGYQAHKDCIKHNSSFHNRNRYEI